MRKYLYTTAAYKKGISTSRALLILWVTTAPCSLVQWPGKITVLLLLYDRPYQLHALASVLREKIL